MPVFDGQNRHLVALNKPFSGWQDPLPTLVSANAYAKITRTLKSFSHNRIHELSASADGSVVTFTSMSNANPAVPTMYVMEARTGKYLAVLAGHTGSVSPDGSRVAYVTRNGPGAGIVVRAVDGSATCAIPNTQASYEPVTWSRDGKLMYFPRVTDDNSNTRWRYNTYSIDPRDLSTEKLLLSDASRYSPSPDGKTALAYRYRMDCVSQGCYHSGTIDRVNSDGSGRTAVYTLPARGSARADGVESLSWAPSGTHFLINFYREYPIVVRADGSRTALLDPTYKLQPEGIYWTVGPA